MRHGLEQRLPCRVQRWAVYENMAAMGAEMFPGACGSG